MLNALCVPKQKSKPQKEDRKHWIPRDHILLFLLMEVILALELNGFLVPGNGSFLLERAVLEESPFFSPS